MFGHNKLMSFAFAGVMLVASLTAVRACAQSVPDVQSGALRPRRIPRRRSSSTITTSISTTTRRCRPRCIHRTTRTPPRRVRPTCRTRCCPTREVPQRASRIRPVTFRGPLRRWVFRTRPRARRRPKASSTFSCRPATPSCTSTGSNCREERKGPQVHHSRPAWQSGVPVLGNGDFPTKW